MYSYEVFELLKVLSMDDVIKYFENKDKDTYVYSDSYWK